MGTLILRGPQPPSGDQWCSLCAASWKSDFVTRPDIAEKINLIVAGKLDEVLWIPPPGPEDSALLATAVTTGLCFLSGQQLWLPLCWSHVTGIELRVGGGIVQAAGPADMPGGVRLDMGH